MKEKIKKEWSPNRYIVNALRRIWRWSPERRKIKNETKVCSSCKKRLNSESVEVDHVSPVGSRPKEFTGWDLYLRRLFCKSTGLTGLCHACHKEKTNKERLERKKLNGNKTQ